MPIHETGPAKSGPPKHRPRAPAPPPPPRWRVWVLLAGFLLSFWLLTRIETRQATVVTLTYTQFRAQVGSSLVSTAVISQTGAVTGVLKDGSHYASQIPVALPDSTLSDLLRNNGVQISATGPPQAGPLSIILSLLPLAFVVVLFIYMGRATRRLAGGSGLGGIGRSRAKLYDAERPSTTFADVAGYEGAKQEITEVVDYLKQPDRYKRAGAVGPRGVLMVGPPGTGKTLLARAVAGEAGVPFYSLTGSSFVEIFVGVGAARMRDLFAEARKRAPSIVFIDEIDAIGQRRGGGFVQNDEQEQTLNQLLAEMDGFETSSGVVLIGATNRPETLDAALLRPGRFDRQIEIPLPNQKEREAILEVHSKDKKLGPDVDLGVVSRGTPGFSGADLANLVNEAAIFAVRGGRQVITADDFSDARDRILIGRRDVSNALLPEEKHAVAIHEAGHALVAVLSEHADPVAKVTILPAGRALGVTEQLPEDERRLYPESYLKDSLAVRLGGRSAERLVLGEVSTGAANDLAGATQLAIRMVREFGMSQRLGPVGFSSDGPTYLGDQQISRRSYAEETQRVIDEEVERLLVEAERRATALLEANRDPLDRLVAMLEERETVDGADVLAIVARPVTATT